MKKNIAYAALMMALTVSFSGCVANNTENGKKTIGNIYDRDANSNYTEDVYEHQGMEIALVAAQMGKILYDTMESNLKAQGKTEVKQGRPVVKFPKIAITTLVDTDTFETSGFLGRELSEIFVHELNRRNINVVEYKLTGSISVNKHGEYVYSRDFKKIAKSAFATHILAGTISRDKFGVILAARIVNMQDQSVLGSSTAFIPYTDLPSCYKTKEKNCSLGVYDIAGNERNLLDEVALQKQQLEKRLNDHRAKNRLGGVLVEAGAGNSTIAPRGYAVSGNLVVPVTSKGNYEQYLRELEGRNYFQKFFGRCFFDSCVDPVVYEAQTFEHNGLIIRDIGNQSQYQRIKSY